MPGPLSSCRPGIASTSPRQAKRLHQNPLRDQPVRWSPCAPPKRLPLVYADAWQRCSRGDGLNANATSKPTPFRARSLLLFPAPARLVMVKSCPTWTQTLEDRQTPRVPAALTRGYPSDRSLLRSLNRGTSGERLGVIALRHRTHRWHGHLRRSRVLNRRARSTGNRASAGERRARTRPRH